jgi:hypothetical protein
MTEWEVPVEDWSRPEALEEAVDAACANLGLNATRKGSLAAYRGSVHWHWKRGKERGVLEVTLWPPGRRLWISVQAGRAAPWTSEAADRLQKLLSIAADQLNAEEAD